MSIQPVFLSVVFVLRDQAPRLVSLLSEATARLATMVSDFELIVVDNASRDDSVQQLKKLTAESGVANLQVYALTKEVDADTASWVGLENALGDYVAVLDPMLDDAAFLPAMLEKAMSGSDVVFASNRERPRQTWAYRGASAAFDRLYHRIAGIHLATEAPSYRLLSKTVVNFILQHPQPALSYRHLPATGGFARANLSYSAQPCSTTAKPLAESLDRGLRLLVATTRAPLRLVAALSLFGAVANVLYSLYVVAVALLKSDVAPGWVSLSLQQSGMFFLISLVLFVLGEYILQMARLTGEGPSYHVAQEFTSARITRREKLNIEEVAEPPRRAVPARLERVA